MIEIPLNTGKVALVDDEFAWLLDKKIHVGKLGYCVLWMGERIKLHHVVMGKPPKGLDTDHINRNKLDNQKSNLRFVTRKENNANRNSWSKSGVRHVTFAPYQNKTNPYKVNIAENGVNKYLGYYPTLEEAAEAVKNFKSEKGITNYA